MSLELYPNFIYAIVEFSQSELMFHKLSYVGYYATLVCVDGAPHEGSFWSRGVLKIINEFIFKNP